MTSTPTPARQSATETVWRHDVFPDGYVCVIQRAGDASYTARAFLRDCGVTNYGYETLEQAAKAAGRFYRGICAEKNVPMDF